MRQPDRDAGSPVPGPVERQLTRSLRRHGRGHDLKVSVLLHHYEHMSYRDIAAVAGCSERGVGTRLYRARQQLRRDLAQFFQEEPES